jgi:hypothetical protein
VFLKHRQDAFAINQMNEEMVRGRQHPVTTGVVQQKGREGGREGGREIERERERERERQNEKAIKKR